jgi:hypothetical protein
MIEIGPGHFVRASRPPDRTFAPPLAIPAE